MFQLIRDAAHIIRNMKDVDFNFREKCYEDTPLHLTAEVGHYHLVHLLLQRHANPLSKNREGKLPLELAIDRKHDKIAAAIAKEMPTQRSELFD